MQIPIKNPNTVRLATTSIGVVVATLSYFLPNLLPSVAQALPFVPKLLWALGLIAGGVGGANIVQAPVK